MEKKSCGSHHPTEAKTHSSCHKTTNQPSCHHGTAKVEKPASGYYCPMCPGVQQDYPGDCPKCGMALEPAGATAATEENFELQDMSRRLKGGLTLALPLVILSMAEMTPSLRHVFAGSWFPWFQLTLATPVVFWAGQPFFRKGWLSITSRNFNMFTLIAVGVFTAYLYSLVATVLPGWFPESYRDAMGRVSVYYEAATAIVILILLGQVLELKARAQTSKAIRALIDLAPKTARVVDANGREREILLSEVQVGQHLRVKPGEKVPVDGAVIEGDTYIDEAMITGESVPAYKTPGSGVTGGTVNQTGSFLFEAQRVGKDTVLAHIVHMVGEAQRSRAPIQKIADVVSGYFVEVVLVVAVLTFGGWWLWGPEPALTYAVVNAVAVLIIACPCALGLATPMSIMVGVGRAAREGVLIKNAEVLELLAKVDTLVVDKTGTLTEGKPKLARVRSMTERPPQQLLRICASLEQRSEHPISRAITEEAVEQELELAAPSNFKSLTGRGVKGEVAGEEVVVGNLTLMAEEKIDTKPLLEEADSLRVQGYTVIFVGINGQAVGLLAAADPVKDSAAVAIKDLHKAKVRVVMLTGDNEVTARAVAEKLGLEQVVANVLPAGKVEAIKRMQSEGCLVAMVGDGVNDAPALAQAHVGIAMGSGSDIAMESASVTLLRGDLYGLVKARRLSKATMTNIRQNLFFAFFYNSIGIPLAAGVLYPAYGLLLSPVFASAAMSLSSVSVVFNALRLRKAKPRG